MRYQDYVNEGIDPSVLKGLFQDLGLDTASSSTRPIPMTDSPAESTGQKSLDNQPPTVQTAVAASVEEPASKPAKNAAEERKDRIARLLAAKGSKQSAASPDPVAQTSAAPSSMPPKVQSEKSKLLQQKMEALRKAREARAQKSVQTSGASSQNDEVEKPAQTIEEAAQPVEKLGETAVDSSKPQTRDSSNVAGAASDAQPPSSIPGLSFSPKPTPPAAAQHKRPVASDFIDTSDGAFKRPFGQSRKSQPFLIDVSDDDDDEAMDLDSPEQRPASISRPSFTAKVPPSHDAYHTGDSSRGRSPVSTPPVAFGGKSNLESMNKEIEAMKRKIAEAEAKKKGQASMRSSPGTDKASPAATPRRDSERRETLSQSPRTDEAPMRLPKVSEARQQSRDRNISRSRSRAASERLPIIEAHRREQLLKLQALQSQVKRMEKEIQQSLQEEERLRDEAADGSLSDEGEANEPPLSGHASGKLLAEEYP